MAPDGKHHSRSSWPGPSEPHVIPKQDQPTPSEPEIDLEALMELSTEEQKTQLEAILQNCPRPTEPFISELLGELKKLRRLSRPQK
nr:PREDICTED: protein phosphatase 1 regulatory subunit 14D [Equus przewalskii]